MDEKEFLKLCRLTFRERAVAKKFAKHPERFVYEKTITVNGKTKRIFAYSDQRFGWRLREIHAKIAMFVRWTFTRSPVSVAYHEGDGIRKTLKRHESGISFVKTDISKFFPSVRYDLAVKTLCAAVAGSVSDDAFRYFRAEDAPKILRLARELLGACFLNGELPIGFCSSPAISDLVLNPVDRKLAECGFTVTRYADDYLFSAREGQLSRLLKVKEQLARDLEYRGFALNANKTFAAELTREGRSIRYLGAYLVRRGDKTVISAGETRIRSVARYYLKVKAAPTPLGVNRLQGMIGFLRELGEENVRRYEKICEAWSRQKYLPFDEAKLIGESDSIRIETIDGVRDWMSDYPAVADVPEEITVIGESAFRARNSLRNLSMFDRVREIEAFAFADCKNLSEVTLSKSLRKIGPCAFAGCSNLTALHIPRTIRSIAPSAFYECPKLTLYFEGAESEGIAEAASACKAKWNIRFLEKNK